MIIGSGGAGKSTLAVKLGQLTGIAVIHLDAHYWQPGWIEPDKRAWDESVHTMTLKDKWIIDGNFSRTMPIRLERADTAVFLDFNRWVCLYRVITRYIKHRGIARPDMHPGCPEKLDFAFIRFILFFPNVQRPAIYRALKNWESAARQVIILRSPKQVTDFLKEAGNTLL